SSLRAGWAALPWPTAAGASGRPKNSSRAGGALLSPTKSHAAAAPPPLPLLAQPPLPRPAMAVGANASFLLSGFDDDNDAARADRFRVSATRKAYARLKNWVAV
ncbi:unnamed protein product, partial [Ectocarpus sp. 12 AP-2014]